MRRMGWKCYKGVSVYEGDGGSVWLRVVSSHEGRVSRVRKLDVFSCRHSDCFWMA